MDELDLSEVKASLAVLDKEVESSRQRVQDLLKSRSRDLDTASQQVSQLECFLESLESEIQELVGLEGPMLELHPKCLEEAAQRRAAVELEMQGLEKAQAMTQRIRLAEESWAPLAPRSQGRPAQARRDVAPLVQARQWILDEAEERVVVHLDSRSMEVSPAAEKLANCFEDLAKDGRGLLLGQLCHLFAILRPYVRGGLKNSPSHCGLFASDVLFLLHQLSKLPADCRPLKQMEVLKRKAQEEMGAMLRRQEESLVAALSSLDFYGDFVSSEAALGAVQERLRPLAALKALPKRLIEEVALRLLGRFCEELFLKLQPKAPRAGVASRLLETARQAAQAVQGEDELREVLQGLRAPPAALSAEDVSGVVALLTSAMSLVRQTLQAMKLAEIQRKVLGYEKLQLSIELLGSDLSRFVERRARLRQAMKKEEVLKLMALSFEAPSSEELWRRILSD